jgi:hypothetical protein
LDVTWCRVKCQSRAERASIIQTFTLANKVSHARYVVFVSELYECLLSPLVGLVPYDGDDSQSESEATHDKARSTASFENDNVRVTISGLTVAVSLWLAVPPFASGLRAKVRQ